MNTVTADERSYVHYNTHDFPELGTEPITIESYVSPQYVELQRKHIYCK